MYVYILFHRSESSEYLEEKVKPFDWTFTSNYTGTISNFEIQETNERIDVDKLKRRDKILFYHDLTLFEDELHDNGIAVCSVKIVSHYMNTFVLKKKFLTSFILILFTNFNSELCQLAFSFY